MAFKAYSGVTVSNIDDGADGKSAITASLSNDSHTIPCDKNGANGNYTGANSTIYIYEGTSDVSSSWTVTASASSGITGSLSGKTYTVTGITVDSGYVTFTATRSGYSSITKRFTLTRQKVGETGANATAYWLVTSASAIAKSQAGVYTPASITFSGKSQTGTASVANYAGRFAIYLNGSSTATYTSSANEASKSYTIPANTTSIRCVMYQSGGTSVVLDEQTIPMIMDSDSIEIGGRNLILDSGVSHTSTEYLVYRYELSQSLIVGETYTCTIKGSMVDGFFRLLGRSSSNSGTWFNNSPIPLYGDSSDIYQITFNVPDGVEQSFMWVYNAPLAGTHDSTIEWIKLERGNKATPDWTPAPEDTQNQIDEINSKNDLIVGTQTSATYLWTGKASFSTLTDGQQITYWLPYSCNGNASLNLTMSNGTTTGDVPCYYSGTTRIDTHYAAGNAIRLTYRTNVTIGSTTITKGWWADANYDSGNTYDRIRFTNAITAKSAITSDKLIVGDASGYFNLVAGISFDLDKPILYADSAIASGSTGTNNYIAMPSVNPQTTQSVTLTAKETCYLVGTMDGNKFTPSTTFLTTTKPTSDNGLVYISLGLVVSSTVMYLYPEHPMYRWMNGAFKSFSQIAYEAQDTADKNLDIEASKGGQLIINGTGGLGDNTNFSQWTFDGTTANNSAGSFTSVDAKNLTLISDTFIPIDTNVRYRFEFDAKSAYGLAQLRSMMVFYDIDKNAIIANNHMYMANTLTELTQDLKNGDTVVHLKSLENWNVNTATRTYQRGFIFWNYTNSFGYTYPPETYSRNRISNIYTDSNVNKTENIITLTSAWTDGTIRTGTKLSQNNSGAMYKYQGVNNEIIPTEWNHYEGIYDGVDYSGKNVIYQFPPGTAYAKVGFMLNENLADDQIWVTNLSFKEDYWTDIENLETSVKEVTTTMSGIETKVDNVEKNITNRIWQDDITTELNAYDTEVGSAIRKRVSETEQDIDSMTYTISDIQTNVAKKADGTTVSSLQTTVSEHTQTLTSYGTRLSATEQNISKATTKLATVEQTADLAAKNITDKIWESDITTAIDQIEIGTVNLALTSGGYSDETVVLWDDTNSADWSITINDEELIVTKLTSATSSYLLIPLTEVLLKDVDYTLSTLLRTSANKTLNVYLYQADQTTNVVTTELFMQKSTTANTNITLKQTAAPKKAGYTHLAIPASNFTANQKLYISYVMFERGILASTWNESPEDTQRRITVTSDRLNEVTQDLNGTIQTIQRTVSTKADYSQLDNYPTNTDLENSLNNYYAENIDGQFVSVAEYQNTSNSMNVAITSTGGNNLIKNSIGFGKDYDSTISTGYSLAEWAFSGTGTFTSVQDTGLAKYGGESELVVTANDGTYIISQNIVTIPSQRYTVAFNLKFTQATSEGSIIAEVYDTDTSSSTPTQFDTILEIPSDDTTYEEYGLYTKTFVANSQSTQIRFTVKNAEIHIAALRCNIGNLPLQWTLASGETYNMNVRIDSTGLRVFSDTEANKLSYTEITPKQFAGYYDSERIFWMNQDETHMAKGIIEDELSIGKIRCVDAQTQVGSGVALADNHKGLLFVVTN